MLEATSYYYYYCCCCCCHYCSYYRRRQQRQQRRRLLLDTTTLYLYYHATTEVVHHLRLLKSFDDCLAKVYLRSDLECLRRVQRLLLGRSLIFSDRGCGRYVAVGHADPSVQRYVGLGSEVQWSFGLGTDGAQGHRGVRCAWVRHGCDSGEVMLLKPPESEPQASCRSL